MTPEEQKRIDAGNTTAIWNEAVKFKAERDTLAERLDAALEREKDYISALKGIQYDSLPGTRVYLRATRLIAQHDQEKGGGG